MPTTSNPNRYQTGRILPAEAMPSVPAFRFVAVATDLSNPGKLPFEQMTKEERLGLTDAKLHDKMVEFYDRRHNEWFGSGDILFPKSIYRIPPEPEKTPDYFPWHLVNREWKWCARNRDGDVNLFTHEPSHDDWEWLWGEGDIFSVNDLLKDYRRGTIEWDKSLLERPEGV